ncbi:cellulose binding domain-containing protein [Streptomyces sp. MMCC 100]|uniref:cellulose binding domain-containing protein n=1 Tax=Streptomyces sp. MMCC 100 TaxID=3163555 RepID=UPI00359BC5D5
MWNAEHIRTGTTVTANNAGRNAGVTPGASVSFGFTGSWSGPTRHREGSRSPAARA